MHGHLNVKKHKYYFFAYETLFPLSLSHYKQRNFWGDNGTPKKKLLEHFKVSLSLNPVTFTCLYTGNLSIRLVKIVVRSYFLCQLEKVSEPWENSFRRWRLWACPSTSVSLPGEGEYSKTLVQNGNWLGCSALAPFYTRLSFISYTSMSLNRQCNNLAFPWHFILNS